MSLPADDEAPIDGACHCGAVRFRVRLTGGIAEARRCNCSYCSMRGAVTLTARVGELDIVSGADRLNEYRFNTKQARHFFCGTCGIYTHHQRRSDASEYGVNAACLGISPFDFAAVPVMDGVNHPKDTGEEREFGVLRFTAGG